MSIQLFIKKLKIVQLSIRFNRYFGYDICKVDLIGFFLIQFIFYLKVYSFN